MEDELLAYYLPGQQTAVLSNQTRHEFLLFDAEPGKTYDTPQGKAACEWRKEETEDGTRLKVKVEVPCNATATVRLPDGTVEERGSGTYEFSCRM